MAKNALDSRTTNCQPCCDAAKNVSHSRNLKSKPKSRQANKNCFETKKMMYNAPEILHAFLDHITDSIADYASHQVLSLKSRIRTLSVSMTQSTSLDIGRVMLCPILGSTCYVNMSTHAVLNPWINISPHFSILLALPGASYQAMLRAVGTLQALYRRQNIFH